jgi:hypothetical protein
MISFVQDADHISDRLTSLKRELSDPSSACNPSVQAFMKSMQF